MLEKKKGPSFNRKNRNNIKRIDRWIERIEGSIDNI